jgi:hypothetical protein
MDKRNTSLQPTHPDTPIAKQAVTEDGTGELQGVIDWLETTFQARLPDDITTARIRRKLIQEWKSRKLVHAMALFAAWVGVGGLLLMLTAALTSGWRSQNKT